MIIYSLTPKRTQQSQPKSSFSGFFLIDLYRIRSGSLITIVQNSNNAQIHLSIPVEIAFSLFIALLFRCIFFSSLTPNLSQGFSCLSFIDAVMILIQNLFLSRDKGLFPLEIRTFLDFIYDCAILYVINIKIKRQEEFLPFYNLIWRNDFGRR